MNAETRDAAAQLKQGSENCLAVGTRLSDFEITGVLGEGGFGIVYLAYDHALQRTVAIKEYMPGVLAMRADDGGIELRPGQHQETFRLGLKSFINEARILARFDHPALVKVYRFWEQNDTAYTAMKFYDGRTIKDIVAHSPELVNEAWCRKVLDQILQALDMLYTSRILHRDISPDNIIVQDNGDAVLLDFGSARQIIGDMTRGLTVILKPGYAPVEQYAGDASLEQGPYTDLYALSAVLYFAIVKEPPPTSIGRMISDPLVPLSKQAPEGYSEGFLAAIDKGLAVLAQDRPQTIAEFRGLLGLETEAPIPARAPAAQPSVPPAPPAPPASAPAAAAPEPAGKAPVAERRSKPQMPAPDRRRLLIGGAAAAVLVLGAVGLYSSVSSPGPETIKVVQPQPAPPPVPAPVEPAASVAPAASESSAPAPASADAASTAPAVAETPPPADAAPPAELPKPEVKHAPAPPANPSYRLQVKPWGTVYVDGKSRGVSPPLTHVALTPGKHTVRIANPSYPDYETTIDVDRNKAGAIAHDFGPARPPTPQ